MIVELSLGVMNVIQDYEVKISQFENLLQRITTDMTSSVVLEKMVPSEVWRQSQRDVTLLRDLAKQLKDFMLLLKPERAPTIKRHVEALLKPLSNFEDILLRKSEGSPADSRVALDELRRAAIEGSNFLDLAKEIRDNPSEMISTLFRLKEVYDAKEYLSAVSIPEATFVRFEGLKKEIKNLRLSIVNMERALKDLKNGLDMVSAELSKFRPLSEGETQEEPGSSSFSAGKNEESE
ncbi:hypothetical protein CW704_05020 [Candidatus Bathyarchaeota archaeon]|nr:MAG: hypothetical protein CW704_05020 [Candidatus Bathyarchaeota archaeon]